MRIRTLDEIQAALDEDLAWRLKELHRFHDLVRSSSLDMKRMAIRAGLPLVYAHWEGFVKRAAEVYLCFVAHQPVTYRKLQPCFIAHAISSRLSDLQSSKKHTLRSAAVRFLLSELDKNAAIPFKKVISARSNLNSEVLRDILNSIGIAITQYETKFKMIDEVLVANRNKIAHGEWLDINEDGFNMVHTEVLALMRLVKNDIENSVSTKAYLT